jgi:hypothetical protein
MIIADVISPEFQAAFDKILHCTNLSRADRRALKPIAVPISQAVRKFQYSHSKAIQKYGLRDETGKIVETPLGNGRSKYEIIPEQEAEFHQVIDTLRSEEVVLPTAKLHADRVATAAKLSPMDELVLGEILEDVVEETNTTAVDNNIVPMRS